MNLNYPYCNAPTCENSESITDQPADNFDTHALDVTRAKCNGPYEITYQAPDIIYWTDNDDPQTVTINPRANR